MATGDIHTVPSVRGWRNEREDGTALRYYTTKHMAVSDGEAIATNDKVSHFVYDYSGSVLRRCDYKARRPYAWDGSSASVES